MSAPWLVLAHEATNSGAPRMLLEVLRGMRTTQGADWACEILLDRGGPLVAELASCGPVHRLSHPAAEGAGLGAKAVRGLVDRPWLKPRRLQARVRDWCARGGRVIYSNTATNGRLLAALPAEAGPVITHVHELAYGLRRFNRPRDLAVTLARTDLFLAVSSAVMADLRELGVPAEKCMLLPNFLPALPALPDRVAARAEAGRRLGLAPEARLVTGCGHIDPLKGTDLFVEMASRLRAEGGPPVAFAWLGGAIDRDFAARVQAAGNSVVHFVGEVTDPALYFSASEIVVVSSRVESFSRVALEAGALGRPVLAFAAARGPADLLARAELVPELSAEAMAAAVNEWLASPGQAEAAGAALRERIAQRFLAEHWIGELLARITEVSRG
jgi:glycosyltransferase involved in cell wall biosynthesis